MVTVGGSGGGSKNEKRCCQGGGQRPDQARLNRSQEEFGFYLTGDGKLLKSLRESQLIFNRISQPIVGRINWRGPEQNENGQSRGWCLVAQARGSALEMVRAVCF